MEQDTVHTVPAVGGGPTVKFYLEVELEENLKQKNLTTQFSSTNDQSDQFVYPGQIITREQDFIRGHGTFVEDKNLVATVSGVVERVNKLISVKPLKSRYGGEVGDVVIGRIVEVTQKRWKVDINGRSDGVLMLSSINLPGGVQRRRTAEDQLNMRSFFVENDLISAEVQQYFSDGAVSLHTRSLKYGKLTNGIFVSVWPSLLKRCKTSFHTLPGTGVDVILGINGYIWISSTSHNENNNNTNNNIKEEKKDNINKQAEDKAWFNAEQDGKVMENMTRIRNSILALMKCFVLIYPDTIMATFNYSLNIESKRMTDPDVVIDITRAAAQIVKEEQ